MFATVVEAEIGIGIDSTDSDRQAVRDLGSGMTKKTFLFVEDGETAGTWFYFTACSPDDVRRKYPTLTYVPNEPGWLTDEYKRNLLATRRFDVDDEPSSNLHLAILKKSADEFFASLGEQVLPPKRPG